MNTIIVFQAVIDGKTGLVRNYYAHVSKTQSPEFNTSSLLYEGFRTEWKEEVTQS